jgi:adenosylcobinamide-GDP ribazoletransferase
MARGNNLLEENQSRTGVWGRSLLCALGLLTILPVGLRTPLSEAELGRSRFYFPLVGALVGGLVGGWTALVALLPVGPAVQAFVVLLFWVTITGALHLDGLCDLCDGIFGGRTPEERLRILKDPHLGSFGLVGGILLLLGKQVVLTEALYRWQGAAAWLLGGSVAAARCTALSLAAGAKYPRPEGTAKAIIEASAGWEGPVYAACGFALLMAATPILEPVLIVIPFVAGLASVLALRWLCQRRLGGVTGDCLGAGIELAEWTMLFTGLLL